MSDEKHGIVSEFEYDGIREYENPCPGWWNFLFAATFVFSVAYFLFFQFSPAAANVYDSYDASVADNLRLQFAEIGELKPDEATLMKYMGDEKWLKVGRIVFTTNCQSCHGADGQGLVGPNLTDDVYKNVAALTDVPKVISEGAANGAMPAWKTRLHPNELVLVSAYVASIRGRNLPGPRGPEGNPLPPWSNGATSSPASGPEARPQEHR